MTPLTGVHTGDKSHIHTPAGATTDALPALAGRGDGSEPPPTSARALFHAAGFDIRRGRSWLAALSFYERKGHLKVPCGHREQGVNLYSAIAEVRAKRLVMELTEAQIVAWDSIGMIWRTARTVLTKRQRAKVVRLYNQEDPVWSIRDLAAAFGCSYGGIHRILKDADVTFRARGGARTPRAKGDDERADRGP
jgi:hypothetical protein